MKHETLQSLLAAQAEKRAVALVTELESGRQAIFNPDDISKTFPFSAEILQDAKQLLSKDQNKAIETSQGRYFIQALNPPLRMIIVGAVHVAQSLAQLAQLAGYEVTIIDPRKAFTREERMREIKVMQEWPETAFAKLDLDHRTALVTLSHEPRLDDQALSIALRSKVFYIGSLGSTQTHAKRLERLVKLGFSEAELAHIHAPVGLHIGARLPVEIAVSIIAQIMQVLRQGSAH